jgi:hypothetical protein
LNEKGTDIFGSEVERVRKDKDSGLFTFEEHMWDKLSEIE